MPKNVKSGSTPTPATLAENLGSADLTPAEKYGHRQERPVRLVRPARPAGRPCNFRCIRAGGHERMSA